MSNRTNRRVTIQQLDILWEILNKHREIAMCYNRSLEAKEYSKRKWTEIAGILNAQGINGATKQGKEWAKYWVDYKSKLKKRVSAVRMAQTATGGGPSTVAKLTEMELKFLQILGEDYGQGLPGVQVDPFPAENPDTHPTQQISFSVDVNIENCQEARSPPPVAPPAISPPPVALPAISTPPVAPPAISPPPGAPPVVSPPPISTPFSPQPYPTATPQAADCGGRSRRVRRRDPPMSLESTRRALVESARIRADATVRGSRALEGILETLQRIERFFD